ncbi:MAG: BolA family transcriptional regulator [Rickettsiaceae bacterium]
MAIPEQKLRSILQDSFPNAKIKITDLAGDQDHYAVEITSNVFKGLTLIQQHKLVKSALAAVLIKELHAITIKTIAED